MIPFWCAGAGGCHVILSVVALGVTAEISVGGVLGTREGELQDHNALQKNRLYSPSSNV